MVTIWNGEHMRECKRSSLERVAFSVFCMEQYSKDRFSRFHFRSAAEGRGPAWKCEHWPGLVMLARACQGVDRLGSVGSGMVRDSTESGKVWCGLASLGSVMCGEARTGWVKHGVDRQCQVWRGLDRRAMVRGSNARSGLVWSCAERSGEYRPGAVWFGPKGRYG